MVGARRPTQPANRFRSRALRLAAGKAARRRVPRSAHAAWSAPSDRPDPIALIEEASRPLEPRLVPIRYGRMSLSPLSFLRGSVGIMARDLAGTAHTGFRVQLGGDAHLSNFGVFGTPERAEVFDQTDFDETLPGPWEWDLKRLAVSLVVSGRQNGFPRPETRRAALRALRTYRRSMALYASMNYVDTWYSHLDPQSVSRLVARQGTATVDGYVRKALGHTALHAFPRLVRREGGRCRIRDQPPLILHYPTTTEVEVSHALFDRYLATLPEERRMLLDRYRPVDVAQKVVGVGSVGSACSVMLLIGDPDTKDPIFLQIKQAFPSALEPYFGGSSYPNPAQRVVVGQHLIQEASDVLLGWGSLRTQHFSVRQLWDLKYSIDPASMGPKELAGHAELCGAALARAHARTGDPARISGYLGAKDTFDHAVAGFAESYAGQVRRDHAELLRAIKKGRLRAEVDV